MIYAISYNNHSMLHLKLLQRAISQIIATIDMSIITKLFMGFYFSNKLMSNCVYDILILPYSKYLEVTMIFDSLFLSIFFYIVLFLVLMIILFFIIFDDSQLIFWYLFNKKNLKFKSKRQTAGTLTK